jgi:hypothetical protein
MMELPRFSTESSSMNLRPRSAAGEEMGHTPDPRAATFASLPRELVTHIGNYTDLASAASLTRVSRLTSLVLEPRVWRDLDLYLTDEFLERPSLSGVQREAGDVGDGAGAVIDEAAQNKAREAYALRKLVKG